jgi:hypothetical protein
MQKQLPPILPAANCPDNPSTRRPPNVSMVGYGEVGKHSLGFPRLSDTLSLVDEVNKVKFRLLHVILQSIRVTAQSAAHFVVADTP